MKIYFIRHGQSLQTDHVFQSPNTPLSDVGVSQAQAVAKELASISVDLFISSPYVRALQTAQNIQESINVPIIQNSLFVERKMPTSFEGKPVNQEAISLTHQQIRQNFFNKDWHLEDEENFFDLQTRVRAARDWLVSQNKESVVVATHGYFLTIMVFDILFGNTDSHHLFKSFKTHTEFSNGGITMCEYKDDKWKVVSVNGIAHLHLSSDALELFE